MSLLNRKATIHVSANDNPESIVNNFCTKHNIGSEKRKCLEKKITMIHDNFELILQGKANHLFKKE